MSAEGLVGVSALQKVHPGEPLVIPAATYNTFVDAARDYLARQQDQAQSARPGGRHSGIVPVRNDSGSDRNRFDVLGAAGAVFDPAADLDAFKNCPALSGVTPSTSSHTGKFVVLARYRTYFELFMASPAVWSSPAAPCRAAPVSAKLSFQSAPVMKGFTFARMNPGAVYPKCPPS